MAIAPQTPPSVGASFTHYLHIARRRFLILIIPLVLAPVIAYEYSADQHAVYGATATVWFSSLNLAESLNGIPSNAELTQQPDRFAATQAGIARAPEVAQLALKSAPVPGVTANDLLLASSVTPEANADLLDFNVSNRNPAIAVRLATAYAQAYVRYGNQLQSGPLQTALSDVRTRLAALRAAGTTKGTLYSELILRQAEIVSVEVLQTSDTVLVDAASSPQQVAPRPKRAGLIGAGLGILIAIALVFVAEAVDKRVRSAAAVEALLGAPLIARIPLNATRGGKKPLEGLSMVSNRDSQQAEAFRVLRTSLAFAALKHEMRTLLVTSSRPGEGKTTTVANLGIAFARSGRDVIICDLDARKPSLADAFGYPPSRPGMTDVVLDQTTLDKALLTVDASGGTVDVKTRLFAHGSNRAPITQDVRASGKLRVLPFGSFKPPDPGAFLATEAVQTLLSDLKRRAELVIIDTAPLLEVGDALVLSGDVGGILVVVRTSRSTRNDLAEMRRLLESSPAPVLGFVLTDTRIEDDSYGYSYGYGDRAPLESISLEV
jgi:non-specific protein-tyrosine kinase